MMSVSHSPRPAPTYYTNTLFTQLPNVVNGSLTWLVDYPVGTEVEVAIFVRPFLTIPTSGGFTNEEGVFRNMAE